MVGGSKPGLTVALYVNRANLVDKGDVLVRIGSLQVSFSQGMTISTISSDSEEVPDAGEVNWVQGISQQDQEFPGFVWTQVVISLARVDDAKATARLYWDGVLKKVRPSVPRVLHSTPYPTHAPTAPH